jgi:hypothetical protein
METPRPAPDAPGLEVVGEGRAATLAGASPPRDDLRALRRLRERIEAAVQEVERLRAENAALAARVAALEGGDGAGVPFDLATPGSADELRARLDGFIAALDQALREGQEPAPDAPAPDAPAVPEAPPSA